MISPPTFLADSSSWNDNHVVSSTNDGSNHELPKASTMPEMPRQGGHGCRPVRRMKLTPTSECVRVRPARTELPERGLKCPRCKSTNTKFSYFNNYKLSQPRHLCQACHRCWTHGGTRTLHTVPVGASRRRHQAKRAKPKLVAAAAVCGAPAASTTSVPAGSMLSSICTMDNAPAIPMRIGSNLSLLPPLPPQLSITDSETTSLSSSFSGMGKPLVDTVGCYSVSSGSGASDAGLEQWRVQHSQSFPFYHGMDKAALVSSSATAIPGLFHYLDVDVDGSGTRGNGNKIDREELAICDSIEERRHKEHRVCKLITSPEILLPITYHMRNLITGPRLCLAYSAS